MDVSRIMQSDVITVSFDTSVRAAAALMEACDIGVLPVCENGRPTGMVTDRDIVAKLVSKTGLDADVPVGEIMSQPIVDCSANDSIKHIAGIMGDHQIRRLIVRGDDGQMVGIVSLDDIARDASEVIAGEVSRCP